MGTTNRRGFRSLSPERMREVASQGGKAAHNRHKWTSEEAREAGRKGGRISKPGPRKTKKAV